MKAWHTSPMISNVYIDLLLLDGENSRKIVNSVMKAMGWQGRFSIQPFFK
jgi:hypothetical protein